MPTKLKLYYGIDPLGQGFFWANSAQKRAEIMAVKRNSPADFEAVYQGRPGNREGSIFMERDFVYYDPPAGIYLGMGIAAADVRTFVKKGYGVYTAWDTAYSTTANAAWTVGMTGLFVPCNAYHCGEDPETWGPCEFHFDVYILDVKRAKLDWGDLLGAIKEVHHKWMPDQMLIEDRASGINLLQHLRSTNLPILGIKTGMQGKAQRALNSATTTSAGSVQGWFRQHRVHFPKVATWLDALKAELKDFSGNDDASSDQVDALVHLVNFAITSGATSAVLPSDWAPTRSELPAGFVMNEQALEIAADPRANFLTMLGQLPDMNDDPVSGMCARCVSFERDTCTLHGRKMTPFDSCVSYNDGTIGGYLQSQ